ncbi:MAG: hypothetical protein HY000_42320 [Planctomycetes bacterium]|nr:hypothetical protein [Planctomycetota bacterium]
MRHLFIAFVLISLAVGVCREPVRAQNDDKPVLLELPVAEPASGKATTGDQRVEALEKRLSEMERRHQQELEGVRRQMEELREQLKRAGGEPQAKPVQPPKPKTPQQEAEQEVERMLREAQEGKKPAQPAQPGKTGTPQDQLESAIEQMLRQAEQEPPPRPAGGLSVLNPKITLLGDFLGRVSSLPDKFGGRGIQLEDFASGDNDRFLMREISLEARAAIDPYADAVVKLSHAELGVEIEEAYALFHTFPESALGRYLEGWHAKVGIFRMAFGAVNLVDGHDLPTVDRPIALQNFVGAEGLIRPGISLSKSFELPGKTFGEWIIEVVNGQARGGELDPLPFTGLDNPLVLTRFKTFREFDKPCECDPTRWWTPWISCVGRSDLELGATAAYTARFYAPTHEDLFSFVEGLDLTWKGYDPRPNSYRSYLLQAELVASEIELDPDTVRCGIGAYLLGQMRLNRNWFVGLRGDAVQLPDVRGHQFAVTPFVSYFLSEFNRVRLQYQFLTQDAIPGQRDDVGAADGHTLWLQWVWAIGAHPPEPYYVSPRF